MMGWYATLSVVWQWVASISTGRVPFSIFRGPLAMLLCYFASWRVPPVFILATHCNTSEGVQTESDDLHPNDIIPGKWLNNYHHTPSYLSLYICSCSLPLFRLDLHAWSIHIKCGLKAMDQQRPPGVSNHSQGVVCLWYCRDHLV